MVAKLEKRFAPPAKLNEGPGNGISFDRFLMACVTVKHYTEAFRRFDPNNTGVAQMDYNTFVGRIEGLLTADGCGDGRAFIVIPRG